MASKNGTSSTPAVEQFSIRGGARYLQDNGVDVGEMRLRTLLRQHAIFVNDPNTTKSKQGDSELELWQVSKVALDAYIAAVKTGGVRTTSGSKVYRVTLSAEQLASLRTWCAANGVAEPVRANKAYTGKKAPAGSLEDSMAGLNPTEDDEDSDGLFDEADAPAAEA